MCFTSVFSRLFAVQWRLLEIETPLWNFFWYRSTLSICRYLYYKMQPLKVRAAKGGRLHRPARVRWTLIAKKKNKKKKEKKKSPTIWLLLLLLASECSSINCWSTQNFPSCQPIIMGYTYHTRPLSNQMDCPDTCWYHKIQFIKDQHRYTQQSRGQYYQDLQ